MYIHTIITFTVISAITNIYILVNLVLLMNLLFDLTNILFASSSRIYFSHVDIFGLIKHNFMCNLLRNEKVRNLEITLLFIIIKWYLIEYQRALHITLIMSYIIRVYTYIILIISLPIGGFNIFRYQLMLYNIDYITLGPSFEYKCSIMYAYVLVLGNTIMFALYSYYLFCICIFIVLGYIYSCCGKRLNCIYVSALKKCSSYKCRSIAYNNNNEYINERIYVTVYYTIYFIHILYMY